MKKKIHQSYRQLTVSKRKKQYSKSTSTKRNTRSSIRRHTKNANVFRQHGGRGQDHTRRRRYGGSRRYKTRTRIGGV